MNLARYRERLAELAGITGPKWGETDHLSNYGFWSGAQYIGNDWLPDEDVAQAIQCWEAFIDKENICCAEIRWNIGEGIEIGIIRLMDDPHVYHWLTAQRPDIQTAIVTAIVKAKGWGREHHYYKCAPCKEDGHCKFCDGGLLYCTVCKCGESELARVCPGPKDAEPGAGG